MQGDLSTGIWAAVRLVMPEDRRVATWAGRRLAMQGDLSTGIWAAVRLVMPEDHRVATMGDHKAATVVVRRHDRPMLSAAWAMEPAPVSRVVAAARRAAAAAGGAEATARRQFRCAYS
jgi:hypothetical protein